MQFKASIRSQVLFMGSGLVLLSFLTLLPYVVKKFTTDKAAYLYQQVLQNSVDAQEKADYLIEKFENKVTLLTAEDYELGAGEAIDCFMVFRFAQVGSRYQLVGKRFKDDILGRYTQDPKVLKALQGFEIKAFDFAGKRLFSFFESIDGIPVVTVLHKMHEGRLIEAFRFVADDFYRIYFSKKKIRNYLLDVSSRTVIGDSSFKITDRQISKLLEQKSNGGVVNDVIDGTNYMIGYSKHRSRPWFTATLVEQDEVFSVLNRMIKSLVGFAGIILAFSIFAGSLIAKNIIVPINDLLIGTREVSKKNYLHRIQYRKSDEFRELSDSFNSMSDEILHYINEVKEKARMEKELEVAELVQKSFLPPNGTVISKNLEIIGYFKSASECGGDWWDVREVGDKTIVFIGDATGHGMPSALITAAAHSCACVIPRMAETNPEILESPGKMIEFFNDSIYGSGGGIHMTLFVGVYDRKTSVFKYSNASHYPPLVYRWSEAVPGRKDLFPLVDVEGFRLGHRSDAVYTESSIVLNERDVVYLYTDGIIEAEDPTGAVFSEKRFHKLILETAQQDLVIQKDSILSGFEKFLIGRAPEDDVSFVMFRRKA